MRILLNKEYFDWVDSLPEITNPKVFENGRIAKDGLFSQQIFGPIKSYYCSCNKGTYWGRNSTNSKCPKCHVEITSSNERKIRFAKIQLPFKVFNPIFYYMITAGKSDLKRNINRILNFDIKKISMDENGKLYEIENIEEDDNEVLEGIDGLLKFIERYIQDKDDRISQYIRDNWDFLIIDQIIVIPPEFRPYSKNESGVTISDEINEKYKHLLMRSNQMKKIPFDVNQDNDIYRTTFKHIQTSVFELYDYVLNKLSKKEGLIRANILGKRLDFSGRAVISPDPSLKINECKIPYWIALEILKPQLVTYMVNKKVVKLYNHATKIIDECIRNRSTDLFELVQEFCRNETCVLNRQPTLHRLSVLGFKLGIHLGNTINIHPMVCPPYNADFDGDAMAIYLNLTERSKKDVRDKVGIWNNLLSPTNLQTVPEPNQDIILGIYKATKDENEEKKYQYKNKMLTYGRYIFNKCLPEDYPIINETIDKGKLSEILNDIVFRYPTKDSMLVLDSIKTLGFKLSTLHGYSLGIEDLYNKELQNLSYEITGERENDWKILDEKNIYDKLKDSNISDYIESGARGSWDQVKQLILARGYIAGSDNRIRPEPIKSGLIKGLTKKEFFESCWGARKGLLDTALSTGGTGYLTRQLIYSTVFVEIGDIEDCETKDGMEIDISVYNENGKLDIKQSKKLAKNLLYRYQILEDGTEKRIEEEDIPNLVGKRIKVRSPIYCRSKRICKKCYGDLHNYLHSTQVGIIATQAVGERITQLVLRTFHISGVADASSGTGDENKDIISGMGIVNKLFHKPKTLGVKTPEDFINSIYGVFGRHGSIHLVHFEIIVSAMMWSERRLWRLTKNRNQKSYEWVSILKTPSKASWLLGAAFSNLKSKLIEGILTEKEDEATSLTKLFRL